jgi:RNA polymerase-binding transcription factor DksA
MKSAMASRASRKATVNQDQKRPKAVVKPRLTIVEAPKVQVQPKRPSATAGSSGLSAKQTKVLHTRLIELKIELNMALMGKAGIFNTETQNESLIKGDDAEVAEKQRVSNAALQELDFLKGRLKLVERAMAKIEEGVYGLCEESDEPIGFERLTVVPWARFSVHVQELRERKMREFKVSRLRSEV